MPTPIKTKFEFQFATDISDFKGGPSRGEDLILQAIDSMLDAFHGATQAQERMVYLGKLLYAADRWLKHPPGDDRNMRISAVEEFRSSVVKRLMEETGIAEHGVRTWLEKTFGATVNSAMVKQDSETRRQDL